MLAIIGSKGHYSKGTAFDFLKYYQLCDKVTGTLILGVEALFTGSSISVIILVLTFPNYAMY